MAIAVGGALGSLLRFFISRFVQIRIGADFPLGTLLVNLSSALLIGFFFALLVEKWEFSPNLRALLITGFLGGYSTYSTLFYEAYYMMLNGEWLKSLIYILLSNLLGILFVALGYGLGRLL
ncbi:MAG: fluoride efflux transporter CrcB [Aquificaceae bacterium]|nr:fluoride efflux transporter CrcB [Aquificaceae bacterium]MCS7197033.1 fluoride efflux transporter CrcB [Aquificaceae bacterium]MCX7989349.1 fluoride efflux transporter CrcB [Aquificaceae bacterium]MDW8295030.1 fluoride efflux transporter CrcB [Aquificaceae bacterium]